MTTTYNPWTEEALFNDYHLGDPREAELIRRENAGHPVYECGKCGEDAYYKATIGTHKCTGCGSLFLIGPAPDFATRWS